MTESVYFNLVVEDPLSEAVLRKILRYSSKNLHVANCYSKNGFGYIKKHLKGFNAASQYTPYFILTDLDRTDCVPLLLKEWFSFPKHPNLLFRVAVREVEAWLFADRNGFASYFGIKIDKIPVNPDILSDPKQTLLALIKTCHNSRLKEAILPPPHSRRLVGPDYNGELCGFVDSKWNIQAATSQSNSLQRCIRALHQFVQSHHSKYLK